MLMKTFQVAIRNIGFVCSEVECRVFVSTDGLNIFDQGKQKMYKGLVGENIFLLQEEVLSYNFNKSCAV